MALKHIIQAQEPAGQYVDLTADDTGALRTTATVASLPLPAGAATAANQTNGTQVTNVKIATTAADSLVAVSLTAVQLLAANAARKCLSVYNATTGNLYIRLGATASLTDWVVKLRPNDYYEQDYTGTVSGIWDAGSGNAQVCELS